MARRDGIKDVSVGFNDSTDAGPVRPVDRVVENRRRRVRWDHGPNASKNAVAPVLNESKRGIIVTNIHEEA